MVDIKELIESIVRPLINHPDDMRIEVNETSDFYEYQLRVNQEDIGRVIGKQGRVAQAIRTIVYSVKTPGHKRVRLNILDME